MKTTITLKDLHKYLIDIFIENSPKWEIYYDDKTFIATYINRIGKGFTIGTGKSGFLKTYRGQPVILNDAKLSTEETKKLLNYLKNKT